MNQKIIVGILVVFIFLSGCGNNTSEQVEAPNNMDIIEGLANNGVTPPEGCVAWFDGCNKCNVGTDPEGSMVCTMMACAVNEEPYCIKYEDGSSDAPSETLVSKEVEVGLNNAIYKIETDEVMLVDGKSEEEIAPGSATKIITQTTNFMAEGDLQQGTGTTLDGSVVLIQNPGGSGTFYYVGAILLQSDGTYVAAQNTFLLGDRVEIKGMKIEGRMIYVTYLDRTSEVSMTDVPTVEITKQYATNGSVLMDITPPETIATQESAIKNEMVGNDKDEHGCIGSAGYTWDEKKQKCVRPWEQ